jgi:myo-inositol 2-dehydrogenase/D-chiro-inositol 1-dehydrogenase
MTFKICVIGCGALANSHHGPAYVKYARDHAGTELIACCDLSAQKAEDFSRRFGFQRWYTDPLRMLETEGPDAVCLIVPPAMTCAITCQILMMHFPLLLEKPPGLTTGEIDQMITAARVSGTPNQVAFNRRYTPLVAALKQRLAENVPPDGLQHLQYDFYRIERTDADFSTTAIHGIDATRFLAGSAYSRIIFHYREFPDLGSTTANILLDCTFTSGATAQICFLPVSGAVIERATLHAFNRIFFLHLPIWNAFDSPGSLVEVVKGKIISTVSGPEVAGSNEDFVLNGFYAEDAAFFDDICHGRSPQGDIESGRQSVEIAQCLRERKTTYSIEESV